MNPVTATTPGIRASRLHSASIVTAPDTARLIVSTVCTNGCGALGRSSAAIVRQNSAAPPPCDSGGTPSLVQEDPENEAGEIEDQPRVDAVVKLRCSYDERIERCPGHIPVPPARNQKTQVENEEHGDEPERCRLRRDKDGKTEKGQQGGAWRTIAQDDKGAERQGIERHDTQDPAVDEPLERAGVCDPVFRVEQITRNDEKQTQKYRGDVFSAVGHQAESARIADQMPQDDDVEHRGCPCNIQRVVPCRRLLTIVHRRVRAGGCFLRRKPPIYPLSACPGRWF